MSNINNVLIFNNKVTSTVKGEGQNDCMCEPWNDMVFTFQWPSLFVASLELVSVRIRCINGSG